MLRCWRIMPAKVVLWIGTALAAAGRIHWRREGIEYPCSRREEQSGRYIRSDRENTIVGRQEARDEAETKQRPDQTPSSHGELSSQNHKRPTVCISIVSPMRVVLPPYCACGGKSRAKEKEKTWPISPSPANDTVLGEHLHASAAGRRSM